MADSAPSRAATLIADLWRRSQPQVLNRLMLLEAAALGAEDGTLTLDLRLEAHATAHKLAGSLGMFGFPHGTDLARALEAELELENPDATRLTELTSQLRANLQLTT